MELAAGRQRDGEVQVLVDRVRRRIPDAVRVRVTTPRLVQLGDRQRHLLPVFARRALPPRPPLLPHRVAVNLDRDGLVVPGANSPDPGREANGRGLRRRDERARELPLRPVRPVGHVARRRGGGRRRRRDRGAARVVRAAGSCLGADVDAGGRPGRRGAGGVVGHDPGVGPRGAGLHASLARPSRGGCCGRAGAAASSAGRKSCEEVGGAAVLVEGAGDHGGGGGGGGAGGRGYARLLNDLSVAHGLGQLLRDEHRCGRGVGRFVAAAAAAATAASTAANASGSGTWFATLAAHARPLFTPAPFALGRVLPMRRALLPYGTERRVPLGGAMDRLPRELAGELGVDLAGELGVKVGGLEGGDEGRRHRLQARPHLHRVRPGSGSRSGGGGRRCVVRGGGRCYYGGSTTEETAAAAAAESRRVGRVVGRDHLGHVRHNHDAGVDLQLLGVGFGDGVRGVRGLRVSVVVRVGERDVHFVSHRVVGCLLCAGRRSRRLGGVPRCTGVTRRGPHSGRDRPDGARRAGRRARCIFEGARSAGDAAGRRVRGAGRARRALTESWIAAADTAQGRLDRVEFDLVLLDGIAVVADRERAVDPEGRGVLDGGGRVELVHERVDGGAERGVGDAVVAARCQGRPNLGGGSGVEGGVREGNDAEGEGGGGVL